MEGIDNRYTSSFASEDAGSVSTPAGPETSQYEEGTWQQHTEPESRGW